MDNVFNRHRGFCLNIINMVIPQNTYPSQARDLLADMQSLAFLVALSATVSWESLVTAWSGASESSLSGMRVHVTWLSVSCEKSRQTEKNSRSLAKFVVKPSPHTSHLRLDDG
jgi:hypothetical protein